MTPLIRLNDVTAGYDATPVLHDIDLAITPAEFTGIVGPSGAGKTTLLRLLLGTLKPAHGTIERSPDLSLAYVPQLETVDWNFPVTVFECVLMGRTSHRLWPWPSPAERRAVADVLERLGIGDSASAGPGSLLPC